MYFILYWKPCSVYLYYIENPVLYISIILEALSYVFILYW